MGTLSNNTKVGDKGKDLILQTSGKVYINVKDRFYPINFKDDSRESKKEKEEEEEKKLPLVLFIESDGELISYTYPGDNHLIISKTGTIYKTEGGEYIPVDIKSSTVQSNVFDSPITIRSNDAPFIISSSKLVKFLNAEYLNGIKADQFLRKDASESTLSNWNFDKLFANLISDKEDKTFIDLASSNLTIDTINVKNLNIISDDVQNNNEEDDVQPSLPTDIDIINNKTYITNGFKVINSKLIDKTMYYFNSSPSENEETKQWDSYNENAKVGGFSIYTLIKIAYDNNYIDNALKLSEYLNLLTTPYKLENGSWVSTVVIEEDLSFDDESIESVPEEDYEVPNFKFIPKERSLFEEISYGPTSNCAIKIYDRWFNIDLCPEEIKNKYTGLTFECKISNNTIQTGTEVYGTNSNGKIEGLVVGGTDDKVRIIVTGIDCDLLYLDTDYDNEPETNQETGEQITNPLIECHNNQNSEKGSTISADIKASDVLLTKSYNNIIGNLDGIENSIFGILYGHGLNLEDNCYLVNPNIAWTNIDNISYLKLNNDSPSFIGLNYDKSHFIELDINGNCEIYRPNMFSISSHKQSCYFGNISINEDSSTTIGLGPTAITIAADGTVTVPSAAVK